MFKKKLLLSAASVLALIAPTLIEKVEAEEATWTARSVDQVKKDVVTVDGKATYTIQAGDTVSVIAEALDIKRDVLETIDELTNKELMVPEVELKALYNSVEKVEHVELKKVDGTVFAFDVAKGYPVAVSSTPAVAQAAVVAPVAEWVTTEVVEAAPVETRVASAISPVEEWVAEETVAAPAANVVAETTPVVTENTTVVTTTETVQPVEGIPATSEVVNTTSNTANVVVNEVAEVTTEYVEPVYETVETPAAEQPAVETPAVETPAAEAPAVATRAAETPANYNPYDNPSNAGLTYDAAKFKDEVASIYGETDYSLVRPGDPGDHGVGKAVDFMVYNDANLGNQIANHSIQNMEGNNISYVIWQQQIYGAWNKQWEQMEDRGSVTQNHYDHVHVSFN